MLKGFKSLGEFLTGQQGLLLRARGYVSMKEAVPADSWLSSVSSSCQVVALI